MASHTKLVRRNDLIVYAGIYNVPLANVGERQLDLCNEWGRDQVFWSIFASRPELFLKSASLATGAAYPTNHMRMKEAHYTYNSIVRTYRYSGLPELAFSKTNLRGKNREEEPVIYHHSLTVNYLPVAASPATYSYYAYPAPFADPAVADSFTDEMPENTEDLITRCAMERLILTMLSEKDSYALLGDQQERWQEAKVRLYDDIFSTNQVEI